MDIASWLRELGLECYEQAFQDNDIDLIILPELTAEDLAELGISSIGHRKKLLLAIAKLGKGDGFEQEPVRAGSSVTPDASNSERRQLTVMVVDLVGSTALSRKLDPEDMHEVIAAYQNTVADVVTRFEGYVAKYMGDGALACFGWPRAHEDEAERAVRAGLALIEGIPKLATLAGQPLAARVGIATGLVVVGDLVGESASETQAVVGDPPNLAARLQALADPNRVVVSAATRRLLGTGFDLNDLGPQAVKGLAEPVEAFRVIGERAAISRFDARAGTTPAPMVGRDQELALLLQRWEQAKAGEGQGVHLIGEAGIGKSRVVRAVLDEVAGEPHFRVRYQCSPYYRDSALWPVGQQLQRAAGFAEGEPNEVKLNRLEALLAKAGTSEPAPLIAELLGLDTARYGKLDLSPQAKRAQILEALLAQATGLANSQPLLLVLEDAHWIDPTTLELVGMWLDQMVDCRALILVTTRPDEQLQLAAHPHVNHLTLDRLPRVEVEAIVECLGGKVLSPNVLDTIIARADGVPLFVEELTKAILETGEAAIPASLHDSLMARLDRIPEVKGVAQIAACIGRDFDYALLAAIVDRGEQELIQALDRLAAAELIFRRGTPPDAYYTFKHALVQDAAYETLLKSTRQRLHGRIAEVLAQSDCDELELLAEHHYRAGNTTQAIKDWHEAGQRAAVKSAHIEATGHLRKGLDAVAELPQGDERDRLELRLQLALTAPLILTHGYAAPQTREAYQRASALCRALDDNAPLLPLLYGEWVHNLVGKADQLAARDVAMRCLDLAKSHDDSGQLVLGHRMLGISLAVMGEFTVGLSHCNRAVSLYDPKKHEDLAHTDQFVSVQSLGRSLCLWHLGFPVQAQEAVGAALARAQSLRHVPSVVFALAQVINQLAWRREYNTLAESVNRLNTLADEHGLALWRAWGLIWDGLLQATSGAPARGIDSIKQGMADCVNTQSRMWFSHFYSLLSQTLAIAGQKAEAMQAINDGIELLEETHERACESDLYRIKGDLMLADGQLKEAAAQFQRSLDIAQKQSAKSFELRTSVALARLWAEQGDRGRALDLLTPAYDWFTEGFDLPDLVEAKALLDELQ